MTRATGRRPYYWERFTDGHGRWGEAGSPPGAELAALRRGIGQQVGTVPQMWPMYATPATDENGDSDRYRHRKITAEHLALTLYGSHQQSRPLPVHRTGISVGRMITTLKQTDRFSDQALERRFAAAATATSFPELAYHLRGLVALCRTEPSVALDYTALVNDLTYWQSQTARSRTVRRWGLDYVWNDRDNHQSTDTDDEEN